LVVDDQVTYAKLVQRWLESGGHQVILAETGEIALEAVRTHGPDLVILDVMIPSPSGFEVCQRITRNPATRHIPVLMVSGLQDPTNTRYARELGAADFMTKPLQRDDLLARVSHFLAQAKKPKE
jgi:DNA-binding response OmpR family regulator